MSANNNNFSIFGIVFLAACAGVVIQSCAPNGSTITEPNGGYTAPTVDRNSFEHRYVIEQFKQEGYNQKESEQAANAIIKFNNAQKNRSK